MDRLDYYYLQLLQEDQLDLAFTQCEEADQKLMTDQFPPGVHSGLVAAQSGTPALTISVTQGIAHDQAGQRMEVPATQTVDVSVDNIGATTAVTTPGNSKIISVFLKFARNAYDPQLDGNSVTVNFRKDEFFSFFVTQSAEAVSPSVPTLISDGILICDITRAYVQSTIVNANISTVRRQDAFVASGTPQTIRRGKVLDVIQDLLDFYNDHVNGDADKHPAGDLSLAVATTWKNGDSFSATDVDAGFEEVVADLKAVGSAHSGADRIGSGGIAGAVSTIVAGSVQSILTALQSAANIDITAGSTWADGVSTNPAASVENFVHAMITKLRGSGGAAAVGANPAGNFSSGSVQGFFGQLTQTSAGNDGALRIGVETLGNFTGGTVNSYFANLTRTNTGDDGGKRIGMETLGNFTASTVSGYFADLVRTNSGNDGAKRVGAEVKGGFASSTVRGQLDELDTARAHLSVFTYSYDDENAPSIIEQFSTTSYVSSTVMIVDVTGCLVGDIIIVDAMINVSLGVAAGTAFLRLSATQGFGGGSPSTAPVSGAKLFMNSADHYVASLPGSITVTTAGTTRVLVQGKIGTTGDIITAHYAAVIRATKTRIQA